MTMLVISILIIRLMLTSNRKRLPFLAGTMFSYQAREQRVYKAEIGNCNS